MDLAHEGRAEPGDVADLLPHPVDGVVEEDGPADADVLPGRPVELGDGALGGAAGVARGGIGPRPADVEPANESHTDQDEEAEHQLPSRDAPGRLWRSG